MGEGNKFIYIFAPSSDILRASSPAVGRILILL